MDCKHCHVQQLLSLTLTLLMNGACWYCCNCCCCRLRLCVCGVRDERGSGTGDGADEVKRCVNGCVKMVRGQEQQRLQVQVARQLSAKGSPKRVVGCDAAAAQNAHCYQANMMYETPALASKKRAAVWRCVSRRTGLNAPRR